MGSGDAQPAAQSRMKKKNRMHYSHPISPWHDAPEDARMRPNNPKETLKSLEETRATLKAQLCAVEFYIGHLKTNELGLRPRGSRGKDSTTSRKAKYEAKKEERNKTLIPIAVVSKRGNLNKSVFKNETENIDPNGRSENVSM